MKPLLCIALLFTLTGCFDYTKDFDPWGEASKGNCDRYGNNCQPLCTLYNSCTSGVHGGNE